MPDVDDLYHGDAADFIARRDALAKQLKASGDKDGAAKVKALRKPSAAAWAINQVARGNAALVDDLLRAGVRLYEAQSRAVEGKDDGSLRTATQERRELVQRLASLVPAQFREDAASSFEAASLDNESAALVKAGRLTVTLSPAGFGLTGMPDPPERPSTPTSDVLDMSPLPNTSQVVDEGSEPKPEPEPIDTTALDAAVEKALFRLRRAEQRLDQAREAVNEARLSYDEAKAARDVVG